MAWKKWKSYIFRIKNDAGLNYGLARSSNVGIELTVKGPLPQNISQNKLEFYFSTTNCPPPQKKI